LAVSFNIVVSGL